ncbi:MAG TPA: HAD family hydrolase [Methylomirabilota bacterium]|nr:HAD family hydrolase [Methylomirabilota bacterium]
MNHLLLFDVDGTLISARGAGKRAMRRALLEVYGHIGPIDVYDFHGKTDPQIMKALLNAAGVSPVTINQHRSTFFSRYVELLREEIGDGQQVRVFPGVRYLLDELVRVSTVTLGLLTGNIEEGARTKLAPTGLWEVFRVGAFGSDDPDRNRLPAIAVHRAEALLEKRFPPERVVIIGDTPLDIRCARAHGTRAVAIATGRHTFAELATYRPDHLFSDLTQTGQVMSCILNGSQGHP